MNKWKSTVPLCCLVALVLVNPVFTLSNNCAEGYIKRDGINCKAITCQPGTFVVPCNTNWGEDTCQKCPDGMVLPDTTCSNYIYNFQCDYPPSCPEGTVHRNDSIKLPSCPLPCKCDLRQGYCGANPCTCRADVKCNFEEVLTQNCGCVPKYIRNKQDIHKTSSQIMPAIQLANDTTKDKPGTTSISTLLLISKFLRTTTIRTDIHMEPDTKIETSSSQIGVIVACIASILSFLAVSVVFIHFMLPWWKKRGGKPTATVTNIIGPNSNVLIGDNGKIHLNGVREIHKNNDNIANGYGDELQHLQLAEEDEEPEFAGFL